MKVMFPRNVLIDLDNIPDNFEELIRTSFRDFTESTNEDYTYQDKLNYIDICIECLHSTPDSYESVEKLIKDRFSYNLDELGELTDKEDFLNIEFMATCYEAGKRDASLYSNFTSDYHDNCKIMKLLIRAINVVMNYDANFTSYKNDNNK